MSGRRTPLGVGVDGATKKKNAKGTNIGVESTVMGFAEFNSDIHHSDTPDTGLVTCSGPVSMRRVKKG